MTPAGKIEGATHRTQVFPKAVRTVPSTPNGQGESSQSAAPDTSTQIRIRSAAEILKDRSQPKWLLRPWLERFLVAILYGDLGTFKSFLALHWCLTLAAAGTPTVYLSAEGRGMSQRLRGWLRHHHPDSDPAEIAATLPFSAIEVPLDLSSAETVDRLIESIDAQGITPALVVIDTLSKYSGPLDTDKGADARQMLESCSTIRLRYGATVLIVAHTGHMAKDRPRGSYDLSASTEANFRIERPNPSGPDIVVTTGRLKDSESPPPFSMTSKVVDCGTVDSEGVPETTLVLVPNDAAPLPTLRPKAVGKNQERALNAIREWARSNPDSDHIKSLDLAEILKAQGIGRARRAEVVPFLVNLGVLTPALSGHTLNRGALT